MYGDILVFQPIQNLKAYLIAERIMSYKKPIVVTIYGVSGTAKSEIAYLLQQKLLQHNKSSYCLSIDDYFKTHPLEREEIRKRTGVIGHREINWKKLNRVIRDCRLRCKSWVQEYYLFYQNLRHLKINFNKVEVLIIEGIYAGYLKSDFAVFLDATEEQTYKFRKKRRKENPDDSFRKLVLKKEREDILAVKGKANILITFKGKVIGE